MADTNTKPNRTDVRSKIFSKSKFRTESIEINGIQVDVRQPSLAQIREIGKWDEDEDALIKLLIKFCYVHGTNDPVFDETDTESLEAMPTGKWMSDFQKAFSKLSGLDVEVAEKNSE